MQSKRKSNNVCSVFSLSLLGSGAFFSLQVLFNELCSCMEILEDYTKHPSFTASLHTPSPVCCHTVAYLCESFFFFLEVGKLTSRLYCGSYRKMLNKANLLYSESREFQVSDKHVISALINVV